MFETFFKATKGDRYIFLLNVYFVKIKNEHGNVYILIITIYIQHLQKHAETVVIT